MKYTLKITYVDNTQYTVDLGILPYSTALWYQNTYMSKPNVTCVTLLQ